MNPPKTNAEPPYTGGCACGAVRFTITEPTIGARICHCRACQKAMGGPFLAQASFARRAVTVEGKTERFASSERLWRHFCPLCGTRVLLEPVFQPERLGVLLATLDNPQAIYPERRIWTSRALDWAQIDDDLPQHPEASPVPFRPIGP